MDNHSFDNNKVATLEAIKKAKRKIPMYTGISLESKQFATGRMTVLRRSLQDIFEHALEDESIWKWLRNFDLSALQSMKYRGWAPSRPYPIDHPRFDPEHPDRPKHGNDTNWFYYYTIIIDEKEYWVNVKDHKNFGEVIYAIEKDEPADFIIGHKKSDIENVYSFLPGTGAI